MIEMAHSFPFVRNDNIFPPYPWYYSRHNVLEIQNLNFYQTPSKTLTD